MPQDAGHEYGRCKQAIFSALSSNGLASSVFIFALILLSFFFILFVYGRGKIKYVVTDFLNFDLPKKKLSVVKANRVG